MKRRHGNRRSTKRARHMRYAGHLSRRDIIQLIPLPRSAYDFVETLDQMERNVAAWLRSCAVPASYFNK